MACRRLRGVGLRLLPIVLGLVAALTGCGSEDASSAGGGAGASTGGTSGSGGAAGDTTGGGSGAAAAGSSGAGVGGAGGGVAGGAGLSSGYAPPDIASASFDDGLLAPFTTGSGEPSNATVNVVDDPTGQLSDQVVRIRFQRSSTGAGLDVNRAFGYKYPAGIGVGDTVFVRGHVVIPAPAADMAKAMRKLFYVQRAPNDESFIVVKATGQNLGAEITKNRVFKAGTIQFDTRLSLEIQVTIESALGAQDGVFRIWKDGALVVEATDVIWLTSPTPFTVFLFGQQTQHEQHDTSVLFDEYRYWDNAAISSTRIGPG